MPENDSRAGRGAVRPGKLRDATADVATVSIVGLGRWGSALALALHAAGVRVQELVVRGAPDEAQEKLARGLGAKIAAWRASSLFADVVWLCVADAEIAALTAELGERWRGSDRVPRILLHSSGVLSSEVLDGARQRGVAVASVHPFRSFPRRAEVDEANSDGGLLRGVLFGVEGEPAALKAAETLIGQVGGEAFAIAAEKKSLYHAFGSFASPLLVSLLAAAEEVGERAGIAPEVAARMLRSLAGGTFENWSRNGTHGSFSGPVSRGDSETIALHLTSLEGAPELDVIYRALTAYAIAHLPVEKHGELWTVLAQKQNEQAPKKRKSIKAVSQSKRVRR